MTLAGQQYESIDGGRLIAYLSGLSNREVLQRPGVLSEDYWLNGLVSKIGD